MGMHAKGLLKMFAAFMKEYAFQRPPPLRFQQPALLVVPLCEGRSLDGNLWRFACYSTFGQMLLYLHFNFRKKKSTLQVALDD